MLKIADQLLAVGKRPMCKQEHMVFWGTPLHLLYRC